MDTTEVYKKLKALRKDRKLTLHDLAEKVGSDYQQISRIERGRTKLSIDLLMKMASALETPITEIVPGGKKIPFPQPAPIDTENLLTIILEKVENVAQKEGVSLSSAIKASLVSQIYKKCLQVKPEWIEPMIGYSIDLINTIMPKNVPSNNE